VQKKPGFCAIKSIAATGEKPGFLHMAGVFHYPSDFNQGVVGENRKKNFY
jgi:hypothetical protein